MARQAHPHASLQSTWPPALEISRTLKLRTHPDRSIVAWEWPHHAHSRAAQLLSASLGAAVRPRLLALRSVTKLYDQPSSPPTSSISLLPLSVVVVLVPLPHTPPELWDTMPAIALSSIMRLPEFLYFAVCRSCGKNLIEQPPSNEVITKAPSSATKPPSALNKYWAGLTSTPPSPNAVHEPYVTVINWCNANNAVTAPPHAASLHSSLPAAVVNIWLVIAWPLTLPFDVLAWND